MTDREREIFQGLTSRPELRDLRPGAKPPMTLVSFVTLLAACAEILTGGLVGLFLNDWRWIAAGVITLIVTIIIGAAIEGFRGRKS